MEFRVLQYFLAVAREQSISGAAQALHLSQPTLSRQLKEMEEELGKQLFIRSNRKITLTPEGILLRSRAEEIVRLMEKTREEISVPDKAIAGTICIGAGESGSAHFLVRAAQALQKEHPGVHFHIHSGDKATITEQLDQGLMDFGLVFGEVDAFKYEAIPVPYSDRWGVLMRQDSPLAGLEQIRPQDLRGAPLILSRQEMSELKLTPWFGRKSGELNVVATYNLLYSASIMVEEGMGYALCLDRIIRLPEDGPLCFRPLHPAMEVGLNVAWKKQQLFSKPARVFLDYLKASLWGEPAAKGASAAGTPQDDPATV